MPTISAGAVFGVWSRVIAGPIESKIYYWACAHMYG